MELRRLMMMPLLCVILWSSSRHLVGAFESCETMLWYFPDNCDDDIPCVPSEDTTCEELSSEEVHSQESSKDYELICPDCGGLLNPPDDDDDDSTIEPTIPETTMGLVQISTTITAATTERTPEITRLNAPTTEITPETIYTTAKANEITRSTYPKNVGYHGIPIPSITPEITSLSTTNEITNPSTTTEITRPTTTIEITSHPTTTEITQTTTRTNEISSPTTTRDITNPSTTNEITRPTTTIETTNPTITTEITQPTTNTDITSHATTREMTIPQKTTEFTSPATTTAEITRPKTSTEITQPNTATAEITQPTTNTKSTQPTTTTTEITTGSPTGTNEITTGSPTGTTEFTTGSPTGTTEFTSPTTTTEITIPQKTTEVTSLDRSNEVTQPITTYEITQPTTTTEITTGSPTTTTEITSPTTTTEITQFTRKTDVTRPTYPTTISTPEITRQAASNIKIVPDMITMDTSTAPTVEITRPSPSAQTTQISPEFTLATPAVTEIAPEIIAPTTEETWTTNQSSPAEILSNETRTIMMDIQYDSDIRNDDSMSPSPSDLPWPARKKSKTTISDFENSTMQETMMEFSPETTMGAHEADKMISTSTKSASLTMPTAETSAMSKVEGRNMTAADRSADDEQYNEIKVNATETTTEFWNASTNQTVAERTTIQIASPDEDLVKNSFGIDETSSTSMMSTEEEATTTSADMETSAGRLSNIQMQSNLFENVRNPNETESGHEFDDASIMHLVGNSSDSDIAMSTMPTTISATDGQNGTTMAELPLEISNFAKTFLRSNDDDDDDDGEHAATTTTTSDLEIVMLSSHTTSEFNESTSEITIEEDNLDSFTNASIEDSITSNASYSETVIPPSSEASNVSNAKTFLPTSSTGMDNETDTNLTNTQTSPSRHDEDNEIPKDETQIKLSTSTSSTSPVDLANYPSKNTIPPEPAVAMAIAKGPLMEMLAEPPASTFDDVSAMRCTEPPSTFRPKIVKVFRQRAKTWHHARRVCEKNGMRLMSVQNEEDESAILRTLKSKQLAVMNNSFDVGGFRLANQEDYCWLEGGVVKHDVEPSGLLDNKHHNVCLSIKFRGQNATMIEYVQDYCDGDTQLGHLYFLCEMYA